MPAMDSFTKPDRPEKSFCTLPKRCCTLFPRIIVAAAAKGTGASARSVTPRSVSRAMPKIDRRAITMPFTLCASTGPKVMRTAPTSFIAYAIRSPELWLWR